MADSSGKLFVYSLFGLGFGIYLFINGFRWHRQKKIIENTPTSKIRSIAMGMVEIFGQAVPPQGRILKSPFSNKDCVYYRYTVEEYRKSGKHSKWVVVKKGEDLSEFYIRDNTGTVLIDPKKATIDIPMDSEFKSSLGRDPPKQIVNFLSANGLSHDGLFGWNKTMRYREYFIAPGDGLYIMGTAGDNPFVKEGTSTKNEADIMIQKGKDFYYISDKPEKEVLRTFKWKVIGGLYGGSALILSCLFIVFFYLNIL